MIWDQLLAASATAKNQTRTDNEFEGFFPKLHCRQIDQVKYFYVDIDVILVARLRWLWSQVVLKLYLKSCQVDIVYCQSREIR